ncbi:MAG TPA: ParB/RepB/Spo0J family partition protein [Tepidisphaeraceae bacterium]|jgi:ParB family chromosome partitioning protein
MTKLPEGKNRLDLVREGLGATGIQKRGRLIVSTDRLIEDPKNERRVFRNLDGLIASIQSVGLIEPITVTLEGSPTPAGQGKGETAYRIITGHRRFRAAKAAGLAQVEVLIREPDDELTRRVKSIVSNVQREDVGPVEMAEALQSLLDEDERVSSQDDLAKLIGKDKTWVSGMLRILSLPVELQRQVGTSQLSIGYDAVMRIARLDRPDAQRELIAALVTGASNRDIRQRIDELKGKPGKGTSPSSKGEPAEPKPKRVYHTSFKCTVIAQGTTTRLTSDQVIAALKQALDQAREAV